MKFVFHLLVEKVFAQLGLAALNKVDAELARHLAAGQARLNAEAAEYEAAGQHAAAASLRAAAQRQGTALAGLDDLDAGLARLARPDPLALPAAPDPAPLPPAEETAADKPLPGRLRKPSANGPVAR